MVRKMSTGRARGDSGASDASTPSYSGPALAYPLTYILTSVEAHKIQVLLSKVGLASTPLRDLTENKIPTPLPSYPSTPVTGLPPKSSFFQPFSTITDPSAAPTSTTTAATTTNPQDVNPHLKVALKNAFHDDILPKASRSALHAFLAGWMLNYGMKDVVPALMRRNTPQKALRSIISPAHQRIGTSFALFAFLYRTSSYLLTFIRLKFLASLLSRASLSSNTISLRVRLLLRLVRLMQSNGLVAFFASLIASPALLILPPSEATKSRQSTFPRKTLALSLFTGGLQLNYNVLRKRRSRIVSWIPNWCDSALLYAVGNGQLLWSFLFEPDCFPKSYGDIILARSSAYVPSRPDNLPSAISWPSRRQIVDHVATLSTPTKQASAFPSFISPSLSALEPSPFPTTSFQAINPILDFSPAHPAHTQLLCALLHPTEPSCKRNFLQFWASEWKASARFFSLFLAAINLLKWKSWKNDPEGSLFRFAMGVIQGATVISGSIGTAWALTCTFQYYFPRNFLPRSRYLLNGFLASIFIYAVPASRRSQLGLYVGRLSMDSTWQVLKKHKQVKPVRNGDVLLLALGLAMLTSIREDVPSEIKGYLHRVCSVLTGPRLADTSSAKAGLPIESVEAQQNWQPSSPQTTKFDLSTASFKEKKKSKTS